MKRMYLILPVLILMTVSQESRAQTDTIIFLKNKLSYNRQMQTPKQVLALMQDNQEAFTAMKKANSNYDGAMILSYIGGFCVSFPLGQALGGGEPLWAMTGVGAGLIVLSIPLNSAFKKHATRAVRIYNRDLLHRKKEKISMNIGMNRHGVGVVWSF